MVVPMPKAYIGRYVKPVGRQAAYESYQQIQREKRQRYNEWAARTSNRAYHSTGEVEIPEWRRRQIIREKQAKANEEKKIFTKKYYFYNPVSGKQERKPLRQEEKWMIYNQAGGPFFSQAAADSALLEYSKLQDLKALVPARKKEYGWAKYGAQWPIIKARRKIAASKQAALAKRNALPYNHPWKIAQRKLSALRKRKRPYQSESDYAFNQGRTDKYKRRVFALDSNL